MNEQKQKVMQEIVESIGEIDTENLESAKNYLAGFAAGIKAARTARSGSEERAEDEKTGDE